MSVAEERKDVTPGAEPVTQHDIPRWRPPHSFWRTVDGNRNNASRASLVAQEQRLRGTSGNILRATILGANDGVLTNFNLVMGVVGAHMAGRSIVITGVAGLMAGALSMALGEFVSVRSGQELNTRALEIEAQQILEYPEQEEAELVQIYEGKGLTNHEARYLAKRIMEDKSVALDTMAREEWGIDPQELGGSPWAAATSSFIAFGVGAAIPLLPYVFFAGNTAMTLAVVLTGLALFGAGVGATYLTARRPILAGLRQVAFGMLAAAITYGIGHLFETRLL
jgi:VIT1/CCC1 family predicted Fe2+/Mn2+ transporter